MTLDIRNFWAVLGVTIASLQSVLGQGYPLVTDARCNCYRTNTSTSHYFRSHKFFDFRSLSQYARVPAPIDTAQGNADAPVTSAYFQSPEWTNAWAIQNWNNSAQMGGDSDVTGSDATVLMVNSPNNIYIQHNDDPNPTSNTYLVMRTMRHETFQSAAEIESGSYNYQYLSIRMYARTRGSPGAITAMFTFRNGDTLSKVQESDLEIRTRDPVQHIQYTNQPSWNADGDIPQATRNVSLPGKLGWTGWQYHRMDWTPGSTSWLVDGNVVSSIQFQAPRDPSQVIFNAWSDGGTWSGNMTAGASAELQVQWVEFVYNTTDAPATTTTTAPPTTVPTTPPWVWIPPPVQPPPKPPALPQSCANICSIDQTSKTGTPVLVQEPQNPQNPGGGSGGGTCSTAKYGQCAGKNWSGCGQCASGSTCKYQNDYYSQCL
ncbi:putative glycoside hydrolase family 16 protein [Rosellinia necatrix]|uniref:Putative glycoside hydrolase family 16 protein n=1 Tax=Rosellinia necatrix TaxID=77044 RepID=A0A1W2TTY2_ROSNE|nr:putative glycoside hydrolase family 16 protein [Rosellinia necatrix]